mmetsp:Transcript_95067/g.252494  ORF Transcript_95067/g.252494 Transcript_95067/m.252494 type:complete len:267 (-) Transcript_95067:84-884(-)
MKHAEEEHLAAQEEVIDARLNLELVPPELSQVGVLGPFLYVLCERRDQAKHLQEVDDDALPEGEKDNALDADKFEQQSEAGEVVVDLRREEDEAVQGPATRSRLHHVGYYHQIRPLPGYAQNDELHQEDDDREQYVLQDARDHGGHKLGPGPVGRPQARNVAERAQVIHQLATVLAAVLQQLVLQVHGASQHREDKLHKGGQSCSLVDLAQAGEHLHEPGALEEEACEAVHREDRHNQQYAHGAGAELCVVEEQMPHYVHDRAQES